ARIIAYFTLVSYLMFLSQSTGQEAKENLPSAWISCPEGSNAYSSHQYNFIEHLLTWVFFSQNMNSGFLVSVLNQVEGFVTSLSKDSGTAVTNVWMSGLASLTPKVHGYCISLTSKTEEESRQCHAQYSFVCKFKG
uniref:Regenerating islet-derived 1 n=1 Tax=Cricetulus griseus TaxID=10029 RepID=A0A8C2QIL5_CRIGR